MDCLILMFMGTTSICWTKITFAFFYVIPEVLKESDFTFIQLYPEIQEGLGRGFKVQAGIKPNVPVKLV